MIADFIVNVIDAGIPTLLKLWAKDTSDKAYSLPEHKKKVLTKQLTWILIKHNSKFRIEIFYHMMYYSS